MKVIKCRKCGILYERSIAVKNKQFVCLNCGNEEKILDIMYKDKLSGSLSNLFPHEFTIDDVKCLSMESFIQSLRVKEKDIQNEICLKYNGYIAQKLRLALPDWRKTGKVYWQSKEIVRNSEEYDELITKAYDRLFENNVFRYCLNSFKDYYFIHSIGCDDSYETLLTEEEYISQLNRLVKKL